MIILFVLDQALVLLLSVNALAAPQGEVKEETEKETREAKPLVPESRQLLSQEVFLQDPPQFGARINPQYYYQQAQQYYPGQQLTYIRGNPAQVS